MKVGAQHVCASVPARPHDLRASCTAQDLLGQGGVGRGALGGGRRQGRGWALGRGGR